MVYKLRDYQQECVDIGLNFFSHKKVNPSLIVAPVACHSKGYPILMYNGLLKVAEKIKVGDLLMGDDSTGREVLETHTGIATMYEIKLRNGISFKVNGEHILHLVRTGIAVKPYYDNTYPKIVDISVNNYLQWANSRKALYKIVRTGVNFHNEYTLELDPYFLGLWLGDGSRNSPSITTKDTEIIDYVTKVADKFNLSIRIAEKKDNKAATVFLVGTKGVKNPVLELLRQLKVSTDKHIPMKYKTASFRDRISLLEGILDSDGHLDHKKGRYDVIFKDKKLANDLYFLAGSLGLNPTINKSMKSCTNCKNKEKRLYYRLSFRWDYFIDSKLKRNKEYKYNKFQGSGDLYSFSVTKVDKEQFYGFTVNENNLYVDSNFIIQHNSGKSLILSKVAQGLDAPCIVFQPSKELLEQNYEKFTAFGGEAKIFSASMGVKEIGFTTFATIGSVKKHAALFKKAGVKYIIMDEAHLFNPKKEDLTDAQKKKGKIAKYDSMYGSFIEQLGIKHVLGLTATPIRLKTYSNGYGSDNYSQLNMLTRTIPKFYKEVLHVVTIESMVKRGFWSPLKYELHEYDKASLVVNTTGAEFTIRSIKQYVDDTSIVSKGLERIRVLQETKKSILVFVDSLETAELMKRKTNNATFVCGSTPKKERAMLVAAFKSKEIQVMYNVGVFTTGFDHPELDTVVLMRPTMSLGLYYQMLGRSTRIHPNKSHALIVDLAGNVERFGKLEDLNVDFIEGFGWGMFSKDNLLTGIPMSEENDISKDKLRGKRMKESDSELSLETINDFKMWFGKHKGLPMPKVPISYMLWSKENIKNQSKTPNFKRMMKYLEHIQLQSVGDRNLR